MVTLDGLNQARQNGLFLVGQISTKEVSCNVQTRYVHLDIHPPPSFAGLHLSTALWDRPRSGTLR